MLRSIVFAKSPISDEAILSSVQTKPEAVAPSKTVLRDIWTQDPTTKHAVDLYVQLINKGFQLGSKDFNVQADIDLIDHNSSWPDHMDRFVRDSIVFGTSFGEYMYNKGKKKIVGLWNMSPMKTDFIRNQDKAITIDSSGKPEGYIQEVGVFTDTKAKVEGTPGGQRGIIFKSDKMYHFSFETFSGTIEGISRLQTVYDTVVNKMEAEKGVKEAIKRFGIPIIKVEVGDDKHIASPESIKKTTDELAGVQNKSVIVTPYWQKIDLLQPNQIAKISDNLGYYNNQIPVGFQIPRALILETGESVNRATLRQQIRLFVTRIERDREKVQNFLNMRMLPFIGKVNKWNHLPVPTWDPVTLEDLESYADRMVKYVKEEILSPDEVKENIKRVEEI